MSLDDQTAEGLVGHAACVTGGAGFIGSHLCRALVEAGATVRVIDDLSNGLASNLDPVADRVRLVRGSILDDAALAEAVEGARTVFHLAAIASVPRSVEEPALYSRVNTIGTLHVLEAARRAGVARVIFAASSSAYGDQPGMPRVETMPPDPRSPYAAAKCAGEHLVRAYAHCYDLDAISLRYFNVFGPRQRADSPYAAVIPRFLASLRRGEPALVYGDGLQTRDFTHVSNAVRANLLAATCDHPLLGRVVNVACGRSTTVLELVEMLASRLGVPPRWVLAPARPGEVKESLASIDAARALLGYEPLTSLEEGLDDVVAAC